MQSNGKLLAWLHFSVLIWLASWLLAVPLFHVHPEADHRHGEAGHIHGGTVHTVWSPDLDCEFDHPREVDRTGAAGDLVQVSHTGDGHAEFSVPLLTDSSDRKHIHRLFTQSITVNRAGISDPVPSIRGEQLPTALSSSLRSVHDIPTRGPPSLFI
jgi:hypothetical protein